MYVKMPRGNKRYFSTRPLKKTTEHKTKHDTNSFRIDNISETSGDSISLNEKPSTSKQAVQYPTRTFENRSALEAFKTGFWKKPDKEHDAAVNAKKKMQRKQSKRSYVNFNAFNYSDPEDYADADSYSNGPTMRYVDVARSALCSRSSPTPVQKIQQRAPNLDLHEFPYLKSNRTKTPECNEPQMIDVDANDMFEIEETIEEYKPNTQASEHVRNGIENGLQELDTTAEEFEEENEAEGEQLDDLDNQLMMNQPDNIQLPDEEEEEEEEQLVHPLAFQSLSPYPSSSFVYINPNMENNFDYIEPPCCSMQQQTTNERINFDFNETECTLQPTPTQPTLPTPTPLMQQPPLPLPLPTAMPSSVQTINCNPSLVEKFSALENESEFETTSNFGYGAGDYTILSDTCTIQHSETTSQYTEARSSDGLQRDDANSTGSGGNSPWNFEWLEMMVQQLSGPFDVEVPNFNFLEAHRDFPRFEHQFEDNNYLRLEERAMFGLRIAENKGFFKDGPYI